MAVGRKRAQVERDLSGWDGYFSGWEGYLSTWDRYLSFWGRWSHGEVFAKMAGLKATSKREQILYQCIQIGLSLSWAMKSGKPRSDYAENLLDGGVGAGTITQLWILPLDPSSDKSQCLALL